MGGNPQIHETRHSPRNRPVNRCGRSDVHLAILDDELRIIETDDTWRGRCGLKGTKRSGASAMTAFVGSWYRRSLSATITVEGEVVHCGLKQWYSELTATET